MFHLIGRALLTEHCSWSEIEQDLDPQQSTVHTGHVGRVKRRLSRILIRSTTGLGPPAAHLALPEVRYTHPTDTDEMRAAPAPAVQLGGLIRHNTDFEKRGR
jgi:hypothetical protein